MQHYMSLTNKINADVDAVVMLTMSNWKTELRSNRYHYASRFANGYPVIFVQPDLVDRTYKFETTELDNVFILHVYSNYHSQLQVELIAEALNSRGVISPLLWIYNPAFVSYIKQAYTPYKIYHATEDYFSPDYLIDLSKNNFFLTSLVTVIGLSNEIVCVSAGVRDSIITANYKWKNKTRVISNGCDFEFYYQAPQQSDVSERSAAEEKSRHQGQKIALYQGNIFNKIDFSLLTDVVDKMLDWEFQFCGPLLNPGTDWENLVARKNVFYLGILSPEELREVSLKATVGIIPFCQTVNLVQKTLPLKAFEYVACKLPVVTTPIDALRCFEDVFLFAETADAFVNQILVGEQRRRDNEYITHALSIARGQSYHNKFKELIDGINQNLNRPKTADLRKFNILVLYEIKSCSVSTIKEHIESFVKYSVNHIDYAAGTDGLFELKKYDAVVIHYSLRLSVEHGGWTLSQAVRASLKKYGGLKIAFIQDEYDTTNVAIQWLIDLGIHLVFTCVPEAYIHQVYPKDRLPCVNFVSNLTGYVPDGLINYPVKPVSQRKIKIAYRGRNLPYWYGSLGQEKEFIGRRMKTICLENNIIEDIEWDGDKRIYGSAWYEFLASSKVTLGTESGSTIFDFDGSLSKTISGYLEKKPDASYQEIFNLFLKEHEGMIKMNQISPKIFEAICLHTALVLFEGEYSNILEPNIHYIVLKKDFSNIDDVLEKINNDDYLTTLTNRAYQDVILSHQYSYHSFVKLFDNHVNALMPMKEPNIVNLGEVPAVFLTRTKRRITIMPFVARSIVKLGSSVLFKKLKLILKEQKQDGLLIKIKNKLVDYI